MPTTLKSQLINSCVPESDRYSSYSRELSDRRDEHRLRELVCVTGQLDRATVQINGEAFINFCSNDYLGLASHPELIRRSIEYTQRYGTGSSASRLISGSFDYHHDVERKIANLHGRDTSLLLGSGFQANITILPALTGRGDLILADKHCHNSLIQGGLLSRADFLRFRHNDPMHLEQLLQTSSEKGYRSIWVVTESLFSMDGDFAPLDEIIQLCKKFNSFIYVDDAHAFGVWGKSGLGLCASRSDIDLVLGTLGKSGGGYGAYLVTSNTLKDYIVNYCSGFIYTTSPPPSIVGAADAAFDLIPGMETERNHIIYLISKVREGLQRHGYESAGDTSQIIPVLMDSEKEALDIADVLYSSGIYVQAIRPPTVEKSCLRITLSSAHTDEHVEKLLKSLEDG